MSRILYLNRGTLSRLTVYLHEFFFFFAIYIDCVLLFCVLIRFAEMFEIINFSLVKGDNFVIIVSSVDSMIMQGVLK